MKTLIPVVLLGVSILGMILCLAQPEQNGCPGGVCPVKTPPATPKNPFTPPLKPKLPR